MMLVGMLMAASLFGYAIGMIVGLRVQLFATKEPVTLPPVILRRVVPMADTRIEHPAVIHPGVRRLRTFL